MPTGIEIGSIVEQLLALFSDPMSNLGAALALYAVIAVLVLIVLTLGVLVVLGGSDEDDADPSRRDSADPAVGPRVDDDAVESTDPADISESAADEDVREDPATLPVRRRRPKAVALLIVLSIFAVVWATAGYSTSSADTCAGCHAESPHAKADTPRDPHAAVACVACHEPGGPVSRALVGVAPRLFHVVGNMAGSTASDGYGRVTRSACASCHADAIADTTIDADRGIRMSHKEPLAQGASCLDCHRLQAGTLLARGVGMNPCLRCHDSKKAPSDCATCHDKKAANAARVRKVTQAVQIPDVKCGGCHDQKKECDSCHGVRLPHTKEFMTYAHARAGAADLWFNGGRTCAKCHTPTRNPCTACHSALLGSGHGPAMATAHRKASSASCGSCHTGRAFMAGRDFCKDLCHSSEAIAGSVR